MDLQRQSNKLIIVQQAAELVKRKKLNLIGKVGSEVEIEEGLAPFRIQDEFYIVIN